MQSLQNRILGARPRLDAKKPSDLLRVVRAKLKRAQDESRLKGGPDVLYERVQLYPQGVRLPEKAPKDACVIVGGVKDFRRQPASAYLVRDDGAWLHFTILVREHSRTLDLLAYDFELVFPEGHMPWFFRIDLNPEDHENEERELRSHYHPGNDEFLAPAPLMTPEEILDLLIWGMRSRNPAKMRA